jgi:hypothetical protein
VLQAGIRLNDFFQRRALAAERLRPGRIVPDPRVLQRAADFFEP